MKFSIIIALKNTKAYLKKCLESIVNQTIDSFEIIVVDDNSNEKSDDIIKDFNDARIQYLYLDKAAGIGGVRNFGLNLAKGEFISFIDSDDWIDYNFLENVLLAMQSTNAQIGVVGRIRDYGYETSKNSFRTKYDNEVVLNGRFAFKIMTMEYSVGMRISTSVADKIFRRRLIEDNHIRFLENTIFEEIPFIYSAMLNAEKIVLVKDAFYHHFKREGSILLSFQKQNIDDICKVCYEIKQLLQKNSLYEEYSCNLYKTIQHLYNLIVKQIFQYVRCDHQRKELLAYSLKKIGALFSFEELIRFMTAEEIRSHIQPEVENPYC
jgi:glycosyltransferase involved in cell wall biosynthesis